MREELLGFFGLSWQEKMANDLYNIYTDPVLKYNALMTVTHGSPWNTAYINQIESSYKEAKAAQMSDADIGNYLRQRVAFANPAMADTYVKLRDTEGGSGLANVISSVVNPVSQGAKNLVSSVASPLTPIILGVAAIAVVGFIMYTSKKKASL